MTCCFSCLNHQTSSYPILTVPYWLSNFPTWKILMSTEWSTNSLAHPLRSPRSLSNYPKIVCMVHFQALFTFVSFAYYTLCCIPAYWTPTYPSRPDSFMSSMKTSTFPLGTSSPSDIYIECSKHCARAFPGFVHCWWAFFYYTRVPVHKIHA